MQSIELIFREFLSFLSIKNHSQNYSLIPKGCNFEYFILLYSSLFTKSMEKAGRQMDKYSKLFSPSLKGVILNTLSFSIHQIHRKSRQTDG